MSEQKKQVKLFEGKSVRHEWDEEAEKWWLSVVDICAVLTDSDYQTARKYWSVLKTRLKNEGSQLATNCSQLKAVICLLKTIACWSYRQVHL